MVVQNSILSMFTKMIKAGNLLLVMSNAVFYMFVLYNSFLGRLGEWFNPPAWKVGVSVMAP